MAPLMKFPPSSSSLPIHRGPVEFCVGSEADHEAVYQTLLHVFHAPDRDSFLGALSDPDYRPDQRFLVKVDGRVASHIHTTSRKIRYAGTVLPMNGVMWVATLPEYRGLGFAQNLLRLAEDKARQSGVLVQALTTGMPQFYRPLGWAVCGKQTLSKALSRNLQAGGDGMVEAKGGVWHVRPWRQVELGDLMRLYDEQYGSTTGSIVRTEDYWRWIIGRRYAHVIWVACLGEAVHGYAFVKDHKILEIATDPEKPQALKAILGRVRSEALERGYPEVLLHAPVDHPAVEAFRQARGTILDQDELEGSVSMYQIPAVGRFLTSILSELSNRASESGNPIAQELGIQVDDARCLIRAAESKSRSKVEPDKLGRRYLTLSRGAFARLVMGHSGIERAIAEDGVEASTATAIEAAKILFPVSPIWRSPLDSATA
jgi:GNAT superfamily N-acetyltransferase